jgi:hypothetical protein
MFVATLGKIPRFFWFFLPPSSSSSPVPSPLPILALLASPTNDTTSSSSSSKAHQINNYYDPPANRTDYERESRDISKKEQVEVDFVEPLVLAYELLNTFNPCLLLIADRD